MDAEDLSVYDGGGVEKVEYLNAVLPRGGFVIFLHTLVEEPINLSRVKV